MVSVKHVPLQGFFVLFLQFSTKKYKCDKSHTYTWDNKVEQVFHNTFFNKTGHLKMDPDPRSGGGQQVGQAGQESSPLT